MESPRQSSLEMYHRRRHRATPGRGASLGARARSEAIWVLLARKKCLKMQMKCFLPEPRFPLEPCTVANGAGAAAMLERRQLRLLVAWSNWWHRSSFQRQWVSMKVASTFTMVVVLPDARHHSQHSGCALRPFEGSSGQCPQNGRERVFSPPAEAVCSSPEQQHIALAALVLCEDGQWWAPSVCSRGARWSLVLLETCRTRFLAMVWQRSAAH